MRRGEDPATATEGRNTDTDALASSFEDFYEIEHARLFGSLYLITRNRQEAEDLMQDAFLRVWGRWAVVQGLNNPTGYLYRTGMNAFLSKRRRATVATRVFARRAVGSETVEGAEARTDVGRALAELTPRQRAAVVLVDLLGFPPTEAADTLRVAPSTVRVLLSRAREALRQTIGERDG